MPVINLENYIDYDETHHQIPPYNVIPILYQEGKNITLQYTPSWTDPFSQANPNQNNISSDTFYMLIFCNNQLVPISLQGNERFFYIAGTWQGGGKIGFGVSEYSGFFINGQLSKFILSQPTPADFLGGNQGVFVELSFPSSSPPQINQKYYLYSQGEIVFSQKAFLGNIPSFIFIASRFMTRFWFGYQVIGIHTIIYDENMNKITDFFDYAITGISIENKTPIIYCNSFSIRDFYFA